MLVVSGGKKKSFSPVTHWTPTERGVYNKEHYFNVLCWNIKCFSDLCLMTSAATPNKLFNWLPMLTVIMCAGADNFILSNSLTVCSWPAFAIRPSEDKQVHFATSLYITRLKVDRLYVAWTRRSNLLSILTAASVTKPINIKSQPL